MFSLIQFNEDLKCKIYPTKKLYFQKDECVVIKHRGVRYAGRLLIAHDNQRYLQKFIEDCYVSLERFEVEVSVKNLSGPSCDEDPYATDEASDYVPTGSLEGTETNLTNEKITRVSKSNPINKTYFSDSGKKGLSSDEDPYATDEASDYLPSDSLEETERNLINEKITRVSKSNLINKTNFSDSGKKGLSSDEDPYATDEASDYVPSDILEKTETHFIKKKNTGVPKSTYFSDSDQKETDVNFIRKKKSPKKHSCLYCGKLYSKIARHLAHVHSKEPDVVKFISLPPKNPLRLKLIDDLRKSGNFKYNSTLTSEDDQVLPIACRRAQKYKLRPPDQFIPCPKCRGYYSKFSLRNHIKKCGDYHNSFGRNLQSVSRSDMHHNIHPLATGVLKKCVLHKLNVDTVGSIVRQDELIIVYGNRLCRKYRRQQYQNYQMIRNRLRTIGRFLIVIRRLNPAITCLKDSLTLENVENIVKAIENVANLNEEGTKFRSSSTGYALTNQIRYITTILAGEYTKKNDKQMAELTFSLSKVLDAEFSESINATVKETQHEINRQKNIILPKTEQIHQFSEFLKNKMLHYYMLVMTKFSKDHWRQLASYTLVSIQVFNRKRTGEVQNMTLQDFESYKFVDKNVDKEFFNTLDEEEKKMVKKYIQVSLRSKRGLRADGTPILLNKHHLNAIKTIIKHRFSADVPIENNFVFGLADADTYMTLNACDLMRKFAQESNIPNNHLLRGNQLRKHIATSVTVKGYDGVTKDRLCDFMAHSKMVHKNFYELPHQVTNITKVSKLLEEASGLNNQSIETANEDITFESNLDNFGATSSLSKLYPQSTPKKNIFSSGQNNQSIETTDEDITFESNLDNSGATSSLSKLYPQSTPKKNIFPHGFSDRVSSESETSFEKVSRRKSWTTPEKQIVRKRFNNCITTGQMPSSKECRKLIEVSKVLHQRKPSQILTWLRHQHSILGRKYFKKHTWSTPERHLVRWSFEEYYKRQSLPSLNECEKLKKKNIEVLRKRTPEMIKAFFVNDSKKSLSNR